MKGFITNVSVSIATLAVCFGLLELYLWRSDARMRADIESRYADHQLCNRPARDPRLIYEFKPNVCGFNSAGFDDREHAIGNPDGAFRILIVGDSVAQGVKASREGRFSDLLAQKLNSVPGLQPVEIINLARSGYSTSQELVVLREIGLRYRPDLILWSYVLNDPAHPIYHNANGELGRFFYRPRWHARHFLQKKLFQARENRQAEVCGWEFHRLLHCAYRDEVETHIREIGLVAQAESTPVVFAIHPVFVKEGDFDDYAFASIHEDLARMARLAEFDVVDLTPALRGYAPEQINPKYADGWFDPWHLNELGHRLTAEYLFEPVRDAALAAVD